MFQHITILFSFIFAIAFTHILASAAALVVARRRVRFSGLHAAWMFLFANLLIFNWIALYSLDEVKHWTIGQVLLHYMLIVPQYFACAFISMKVRESGEVDMNAYFEEQRPAIFGAFVLLSVLVMVGNYFDRDYRPNWIRADLLILPSLVLVPMAGWAKSRKLQWLAVSIFTAKSIWLYSGIFAAGLFSRSTG